MASVRLARALAALDAHRLDEARHAFEEALCEAQGDGLLRAGILAEIAAILRLQGRPGEALEYAKGAGVVAGEFGITRELAAARLTVGNALADLHEYSAARIALVEALKLCEDLGLGEERLQALVGIARLNGELGDLDSSRNVLMRLLCQDLPNRIRSQVLNNLAVLAIRVEDFVQAELYLGEDLGICRLDGDQHGEMVTSIMLGQVYEKTGRRREWAVALERARNLARRLGVDDIARRLDDRLADSADKWTGGFE